mgnify:CR=1 FL=1
MAPSLVPLVSVMTHFVANPSVVNDILPMMVPILALVNVTTCLVLLNDDGRALTVVAVKMTRSAIEGLENDIFVLRVTWLRKLL